MEPPIDWLELQGHLGNRLATDFDRVFNIAMFLQSLDTDHDVGTGVDLSDWDARLAGETLSFDRDFYDWWQGQFGDFASTHPGVNRHRDPASVLAHLYATLGLEVAGYYNTSTSGVSFGSGRCTYAHDSGGRLVTTLCDFDDNGWVDRQETVACDAAGYATSTLVFVDGNHDGTLEGTTVENYARDAAGNILESVRIDELPGVYRVTTTETNTYDQFGDLLTKVRIINNAFPQSSRTEEFTEYSTERSSTGIELARRRLARTDSNADRVFDRETEQTETRDASGFVVLAATEARTDGVLEARTTRTFTNDWNGPLSEHFVHDLQGDGRADETRDAAYTYTAAGRVATVASSADQNGDGTSDGFTTTTKTHDAYAHELSTSREYDRNGDGQIDSIVLSESSYDGAGNLVAYRSGAATTTHTYSPAPDALYYLVNAYLLAWSGSER